MILKPNGGSRGRGVIQLSQKGNRKYQVYTENQKKVIYGKNATYSLIKRLIGTGKYIVQRRIPLAKIVGRPFDIRVIVQRRRLTRPWKVTAYVAKVAGSGYFVTNIARSKGRLMQVRSAIRKSSITNRDPRRLQSKLNQVALHSARILGWLYPSQLIFGMDMGLDRRGRVWVIEANRKPMLSHFRKMKNKTMYRRIMEFKGRVYEGDKGDTAWQ